MDKNNEFKFRCLCCGHNQLAIREDTVSHINLVHLKDENVGFTVNRTIYSDIIDFECAECGQVIVDEYGNIFTDFVEMIKYLKSNPLTVYEIKGNKITDYIHEFLKKEGRDIERIAILIKVGLMSEEEQDEFLREIEEDNHLRIYNIIKTMLC